ncbi:Gfo/Idh/MocA family protein [Poseidonocella sp. HB161398]|uniref:Gfo/Idh/MocA family protein n=1 Tax=Poseidonocella sp. HB161398 TaxID=2320855 RepID=UPI001109FC73|nr:Gfo/Idh/MocA family oxidoreductase [Poseidonocella sp. HB161398]
MKFGVVGYGTGGQHFHAPFIAAARGCELGGVVARAPATVAKVRADLPGTPVFASLGEMLAAGVDVVTITTPPETRRDLVLEAIAAGVNVIADKPFAPSAAAARDLAQAARDKGVTLGVYHNRRWDADIRTLKKVVEDGGIGTPWRLHSRMDFDDPATLEPGPTGGLLRDLGSHVVDQALYVLGPVLSVDAQLDCHDLPAGRTDVGFCLTLRHESGAHSHLSASKLNFLNQRELRIYGSGGSYVANGTDVQAQAIFAGKRPADDLEGWGYDAEEHWGTLRNAAGTRQVPSEQGAYFRYYEAFAEAIRSGTPPPVTAEEGIAVLAVLDAARESAETGRTVTL